MGLPLVSIILPIHNAGEHLSACLDSLANQTLKEIEIIAILDCPTDGSDVICESYAQKDSRIRIVKNKVNLHIGNSRNEGLKLARGKYVGFCDHDDCADSTMFEMLSNHAEKEALDLVCSPYVSIKNGVLTIVDDFPAATPEDFSRIFLETTIGVESNRFSKVFMSGTVWNKLFRNDIIQKNNIRFVDSRYTNGEDVCFLLDYAVHMNRGGFVSKPLYYHIIRGDNTGLSFSYVRLECTINRLMYLCNVLKKNNLYQQCKKRWENTVRVHVLYSIYSEWKLKNFLTVLYNISRIRKSFVLRQVFEEGDNAYFYTYSWKSNLMYKLIRLLVRI